ncbi:MAG: hypothetical protein HY752_05470 [Nitrospirae bacterium]|nr:hypothetical protein [Nitrospirota bacterium]
MRKALELTPVELRKAGWKVLKEHLGVADALKFFLQYEKGEGDYTKLRRELFKDETVESLISRMKREGKIAKGSRRYQKVS